MDDLIGNESLSMTFMLGKWLTIVSGLSLIGYAVV
jgi:hypothetical protein